MLDDLVGAVGQRVRPGPEPPAEGRRGLQQRDGDPALGQHHRRADPGDPAAHHDGLGPGRDGAGEPRVGGDERCAGACAAARRGRRGRGAEHVVEPRCARPAPRPDPAAAPMQRKRLSCTDAREAAFATIRARPECAAEPAGWRRHDRRTRAASGSGAAATSSPPAWPRRSRRSATARSGSAAPRPATCSSPRSCSTPPATSPSPPASSTCGPRPPTEVAASYHRIAAAHPGRFLLGVGIGHPEATQEYRSPYDTIVDYLDVLDAEGVPVEDRVLAALGPKVLALAAERTAGRAPLPHHRRTHTRLAREILGEGPLLAPEQKVVLDTDPVAARALGRPAVDRPYLHLRNYTSNLAAGLDRRRPRRRRQRRADRRAGRARRRGHRRGRAPRAPRRRRGPRLPAAAHPARRRPAARPARARDRTGPRRLAPRVGRVGLRGVTSRSDGTARRAAGRPPRRRRPGGGPAGTTPRPPRPAARRRSASPPGTRRRTPPGRCSPRR